MIIWINGAFGVGKTQTSFELHRRIENSFVYDPENVGYFIRKNIPKQIHEGDFQSYPMWRDFNFKMLKYLSENYTGIIIAPMTITNPQYYDEIIGRLIKEGIEIKHFILFAEKSTILKRLGKRFESKSGWAAQQIDRCLYAFKHDITDHIINTEGKDIYQVVEEISQKSNIKLKEDKRSRPKKMLDRLITQVKHIR